MKINLVFALTTACILTSTLIAVSMISQEKGNIVSTDKTNLKVSDEEAFYSTIKEAEELEYSREVVISPHEEMFVSSVNIEQAELDLKSLKRMSPEARKYIKGREGMPSERDLNELSSIYQIPEGLLYSLMIKESNGDKNAISNKKAKGLFQFMSETAIDFGLIIGGKDFRTDEWRSADASARYLAWIFTYFHPEEDRSLIDNYNYVLAGYNAGIGKVKNGNTLKIPNYKETKDYVRLVIGYTKGDYYKVQKGDTLYNIAVKHELTRKDITKMNDGVNQMTLIADSYLLINKSKARKNRYQVKTGDTLYKIAKIHETSVDELVIVNALTNNTIRIGQELSLPF